MEGYHISTYEYDFDQNVNWKNGDVRMSLEQQVRDEWIIFG